MNESTATSTRPLHGAVAVVAGATRGAGRGIAVELGAAGATVYAAGRTTRASRSPMNRPETIEETAELVDAAGGRGIAVQVDFAEPAQVRALAERVERDEGGRLDVLVNDVWGGDPLTDWSRPFWEHDLDDGLRLHRQAVETHVIASWHLAPLMVRRGRGLIVEMTDGETERYRGTLFYDLAKAAAIRLALAQDHELRRHGVRAVAVTPGFMRSEAVLEHFGVTEADWRRGVERDRHFGESETPRFVGRAVAALAADADAGRFGGRALSSWGLAREYGFADVDGRRPDWGAYYEREVAPALAR
jgi:NAD(P)-dependent dehydrogenase (short-subunit alcohol dehydrogenase family)